MPGESWAVVVAIIYSVIELSLSLFILEKTHHEKIEGFEIIAHDLNANYISRSVKEILAKKNKKNIAVFLGSRKVSYFNKSDFEEECARNFKRYFESSAQQDPLTIPWKIPEKSKKIIDIMFQWCKDTNKVVGTRGLVLHSFSILRHAYRHGFSKEILRDDLKIYDFSESPISVVYNSQEGALLLLRKAESENLANDLTLAFNDLKLFILLFHDVLSNSGMKVIPLVVTDKKVHASYLDCSLCKNHVLSEEDFANIKTFRDWWKYRSTYFETGRKGNINEDSSKKFLAKLTGVLSAALLYPNYIPQFTRGKDFHQHMEHLKVLLTPDQLNVYYSQEKHMVLKGGFGCGKSIIANVMLQKISESLKEDEKLFYVCHDPRSELLNQRSIKNKQEKVELIDNKNGRKLSAIIKDITKEERPGKINLVVDEYDGEDLDESEAKKLNDLFDTSFKEAFILLIVQPIEKGRVIKEITQKKNRFDLLEDTMGTPRYLGWNMRNSIEIHELIEATKEILREVKTNFIHPEDNKTGDQLNSIKESAEETSFTSGSVLTKNNPKELEFEGKRELKGQSDENSDNVQIDLDEAFMASSMVDKTGASKTVSSFSYAQVYKIGHQIKTKKPVLFELGDKAEFKTHLSLLVIFKKILHIPRKHVVLHFDTMTNAIPRVLHFAFDYHFGGESIITTNYEKFESSEESILVCSYPTFRGLEHPGITILIDRNIYFVQHYLVEMIARCTSELYIVVLQNCESLKTVTDVWKNKLVDQCKTEVINCPHERNSVHFDIETEYPNIIRGIFSCKKYKELEEAFRKFPSNSEDEANAVKMKRIAKEVIDKKR